MLRLLLFPALVFVATASSGGSSASEEVSRDIYLSGGAVDNMPGKNLVYKKAGDSVTVTCNSRLSDAALAWKNPDMRWGKEEVESKMVEPLNAVLTIPKLNATHSGKYTCFSQRHADWKPAYLNITVGDNKVVRIISKKTEIKENMTEPHLQIDCTRPKASDDHAPIWFLNGKRVDTSERLMEEFDNGTLLVKYANSMHSGIYSCEFRYDGSVSNFNFIEIKGAGYVHQRHTTSKNLMEGEDVTLRCEVYGFPIPRVSWRVGQVPIEEKNKTDPMGRFYLGVNGGVPDAELTVRRLEFDDRDEYFCCAKNDLNTGDVCEFTMVRVKDKLAALWPFLGIVAEVVILVTIIFIYEKRRASKEASEDDAAPEQ